jgi:hypothetical protein
LSLFYTTHYFPSIVMASSFPLITHVANLHKIQVFIGIRKSDHLMFKNNTLLSNCWVLNNVYILLILFSVDPGFVLSLTRDFLFYFICQVMFMYLVWLQILIETISYVFEYFSFKMLYLVIFICKVNKLYIFSCFFLKNTTCCMIVFVSDKAWQTFALCLKRGWSVW